MIDQRPATIQEVKHYPNSWPNFVHTKIIQMHVSVNPRNDEILLAREAPAKSVTNTDMPEIEIDFIYNSAT